MKNTKQQIFLIVKVFLLFLIILSPFINYNNINHIFKSLYFKILILFIILILCFIDFQIALLLTILLMILQIIISNDITKETFSTSNLSEKETNLNLRELPDYTPNEILELDDKEFCPIKSTNDINNDLITHYIDDKIKPYDVFIEMLTSKEALASAQGELV